MVSRDDVACKQRCKKREREGGYDAMGDLSLGDSMIFFKLSVFVLIVMSVAARRSSAPV